MRNEETNRIIDDLHNRINELQPRVYALEFENNNLKASRSEILKREREVWSGMILSSKEIIAYWNEMRGDREEFSADDASSMVDRLFRDKDFLQWKLDRIGKTLAKLSDAVVSGSDVSELVAELFRIYIEE